MKTPANQTALEIHANTVRGNGDEADDDDFDLTDDIETSTNLIDRAAEEYQPRIYFKKRIPQQNIDLKVKGDGKSIADELMEIEERRGEEELVNCRIDQKKHTVMGDPN